MEKSTSEDNTAPGDGQPGRGSTTNPLVSALAAEAARRSHIPIVMTTDFMVTRVRNGEKVLEAYDTKRSEEAEDPRTVEKLKLVRASLATLNIAHHIAFHTKLPHQKIQNIEWIMARRACDSEQ